MGYFQTSGVRRIVLKVYTTIVEKKEFDRKKNKYENENRRLIQKGTYAHHLLTVMKEGNGSNWNLHAQALEAEHGDPSVEIDHTTAINHYESNCGEQCRSEIEKVKRMKFCWVMQDWHIFQMVKEVPYTWGEKPGTIFCQY